MNNYEKLNLYPHNIETCNKVSTAFELGQQVVSIIKATGTGKSYIGLNLALEYKEEKIVWIVPTLAIKEHIEKTINDNPNLSMEKDFPNLEIRTYSSLVNITKEEIAQIPCDLLIVDELHHLGAPVWGERVNTFVKTHPKMKTFGMSAYSVRDRGTAYERDMVNPDTEELFSDTIVDRYDLYDAILDGVLPMPFVKSVLVENSKIIDDLRDVQKFKRIQGTPIYYEIERVIDSITKTIHKQDVVKDIIQKMVKSDGKYIYFCPVVSQSGLNDMQTIMTEMARNLREKYPDKKIVFYQTTSEMGDEGRYSRECFYNDVDQYGNDVSDTLRIMFAKNQYNEGVHAPNVDGVFLGRETGSDIVALEQIGRALSVRGSNQKKIEEYSKYSLDALKQIAISNGIKVNKNDTKEYLIELLIAPQIIDLADNIGFLETLETNLKDRVRERKERGKTITIRQIKISEVWSTLDIEQKDFYKALKNLREQVQANTWNDWYDLLVEYYNYHHNTEVPYRFKTINGYTYDPNGIALGAWCARQRYKQNFLNQEKKDKLAAIKFGFEKDIRESEWKRKYEMLLAYYQQYGTTAVAENFKTKNGIDPVPKEQENDEDTVNLYIWCRTQRENNNLGVERRKALEAIGFQFDGYRDVEWERKYNMLLAYYQHYGTTEVPMMFKTKDGVTPILEGQEKDTDTINLGVWCNEQRQNKAMDETRKQKLQNINFRFKTKDNEQIWATAYNMLLAYYQHYGTTQLPHNFKTKNGIDPVPKEQENDEDTVNLSRWCTTQRMNKNLSPDRRKMLEAIDFRFESNYFDLEWERRYNMLVSYYQQYGTTVVPTDFKTKNGIDPVPKEQENDEDTVNLYRWRSDQRKNENLSESRRKKLETIGFIFDDYRDVVWERNYNMLLAYYQKYGTTAVPTNFKTKNGIDPVPKEQENDEDTVNLYKWCYNQRSGKNTLTEDKIRKLELMGFSFYTKKETENKKIELCANYGINYGAFSILKVISYQALYAKIMFLNDNGYSIINEEGLLHEIFGMCNENMIGKYNVSQEDLILNYYFNKRRVE